MKSKSSLYTALALFIVITAAILFVSVKINDGNFVYALDDTYIHMSMAKNLAENGNFATNKLSFASASSSPLWVLLITAVYFFTGVNLFLPLVINYIFLLLAVIVFYYILTKQGISKNILLYLCALIFISPFPAVLFAGMEHSMQIFFMLVFVFLSLNLVSSGKNITKYDHALIIVSAFFSGGARYEDLIMIFLAGIFLFISGRKLFSAGVLVSGALPIVIYGLFSLSKGGMFFPNTLLLKSSLPVFTASGIAGFLSKAFSNISEPHILILLALLTVLYSLNFRRGIKFRDLRQLMLFSVSLTVIINMSIIEYNHNGSFYRYDAYLVSLGILAASLSIAEITDDLKLYFRSLNSKFVKASVVILMLAVLSPLFVRILTAAGFLHASMEYYKQQYQMAQFTKTYAKDMTVALNDIGMVNYYTENKIFDLLGLSDIETAKHRRNNTYNTGVIERLGKEYNVRLAICYSGWFDEYGGLPLSWKKIAEWKMTDRNLYLGNSTVDIFITDPADEEYIRQSLLEYSARLPGTVIFKIIN